MEIIRNPPDCFEFTLQNRRFIGGFAEKIFRCLRSGPSGAPYRFGIAVRNPRDTSLAGFAAAEGHVFIDTMELIAPSMFEIALGS
jgi:hypothetical protein